MKATAQKEELATSPAKEKSRTRTPNAERSAATRAKILNAAIECLCEVGYHNTSTVLVTERAKVSRGAMLHHFPSKSELILETFAHIRTVRRDRHNSVLAGFKTDREKFLHLIDALWQTFNTPAGIARVEIMMGARCDPEVAPAFGQQHHFYMEKHFERVQALAQSLGFKDQKKVDAFATLYIGAMRGLMIESFYPTPRSTANINAAIAMMKDFQLRMVDELTAKG